MTPENMTDESMDACFAKIRKMLAGRALSLGQIQQEADFQSKDEAELFFVCLAAMRQSGFVSTLNEAKNMEEAGHMFLALARGEDVPVLFSLIE